MLIVTPIFNIKIVAPEQIDISLHHFFTVLVTNCIDNILSVVELRDKVVVLIGHTMTH
jgi:hypothetical protein